MAGTRYLLRIRSREIRAGQRTRVRFTATVTRGTSAAAAFGRGRVRVAGHTIRLDRSGRAAAFLTFPRAGSYTVRLLPPKGRRTLAKGRMRVK